MSAARLINLSKLLSLMLRHEPVKFGLILDAEGYAALDDVLSAVRTRMPDATEADVIAVIETIEPDKRRFSIDDREIRANYGHSIAERVAHPAVDPPEILLHGTTQSALPVILRDGLSPMRRQFVHLTNDRVLALRVGGRRGRPVLLEVAALEAQRAGVIFYRANDAFWLADQLPARFLRVAD